MTWGKAVLVFDLLARHHSGSKVRFNFGGAETAQSQLHVVKMMFSPKLVYLQCRRPELLERTLYSSIEGDKHGISMIGEDFHSWA